MAAFIRTHRLAIARQFSYECTKINRLLIEKALLKRHFAHRIENPITNRFVLMNVANVKGPVI